MLASDLVLSVRASRSLTAEQVSALERYAFGSGEPNRDQIDLLFLIDSYMKRPSIRWMSLIQRVMEVTTAEIISKAA